MNLLLGKLDSIPRRIIAASVVSGMIVASLNVFAESSYVQTQKIQQETARGEHCQKWQTTQNNGETQVKCLKWASKKP